MVPALSFVVSGYAEIFHMLSRFIYEDLCRSVNPGNSSEHNERAISNYFPSCVYACSAGHAQTGSNSQLVCVPAYITRVSITRVILFIHLSLLQYIVYYSL